MKEQKPPVVKQQCKVRPLQITHDMPAICAGPFTLGFTKNTKPGAAISRHLKTQHENEPKGIAKNFSIFKVG